ncbi:cytochrome P450 [Xylaria cf. heliscus]|nr:cytochrome P450 [Xylaria cf. heliscus]
MRMVFSKVLGTYTPPRRTESRFWASIPFVGIPQTPFLRWTRASLRSITQCAENASKGYDEFCKKRNAAYALLVPGLGPVVAVPSSLLHIFNKSENEVLSFMAQLEMIQPRYMIGGGPDIFGKANIQNDVVRKHFKSHMDNFAGPVDEELDVSFREFWGVDMSQWVSVYAWDACSKVIVQTAGRVFFGASLSRNRRLMDHTRLYANAVYIRSSFLNVFPAWSRPLVGPVLALYCRKQERGCMSILVPYVEQRLTEWNEGKNKDVPDDALQWMIQECVRAGASELCPKKIAQRLLVLNMMSTFGPTNAFASNLLDLYGSADRDEFVKGLRLECDKIAGKFNGLSTKQAVDSLYRIDSTVRESMRVSPFRIVSLTHIVAPGEGLDIGNGLRIPAGSRIGVPSYAVHLDPDLYEDPKRFDAFRFSRQFEGESNIDRQVDEQQLCSSYSEHYFAFGYGRHACPARWFVSQFLKQALAYVVQNYEVECVGRPARKKTLFNMILPQTDGKIRIRRRKV